MNPIRSKPPLDSVQISNLFAVANLNREDTTDAERVEAINSLLCELRLQIRLYKNDEVIGVDPILLQGIKNWALGIFVQPDPVLALARFLGKKKSPGRRAKNADRDFHITEVVLLKMQGGMSLEAAADEAEANYPSLKGGTIRKIYLRNHKRVKSHHLEIKAHLAMCVLEGGRYLPAPSETQIPKS